MSNPDDLDDDLDYNYVSGSELEPIADAGAETEKLKVQDQDEQLVLQKEDINSVDRRKRTSNQISDSEGRSLSKRQTKLKKSKLKEKKQEQSRYEVEQKRKIPKSSPDDIIQYFATLIREKNPDLSALELDELYFKKTDFISTANFEQERTLANFSNFASQFSRSPKALVISMTNLRVADVFRSLGGSKNGVKLFSKNKLKDDLETVEEILGKSGKSSKKGDSIKYFVATPTRLEKLVESTDLFFQGKEKLDILVDASYLDPKDNTLLTCDNSTVLCKVLKTFLNKKSSVKILLY
ncbi:CMS1 (YLR003C) [Zygosaccharomyces parabailii]|uniref:BN860_08944g1_1 n=1 Tax=Zygosaccharomyces bailii (strain CLIB 213 / ATCC 58445 / CBS 680 / BCRC 21525 / NBRC 1098 / NCYC 1416 / NRRL Y-2227) TaxID=1333698 RepID=A0A8J2T5J3_ZYGB2|nr:CMS1 (YLR003C) [Zygosaccharomyces parabailii]CDF88383.1 BN860_08944g1_1 [Zygosaccharomyces bailii CLIB 213]CDH14735.1 related to Protein CMS1 [Zygosaccharomyces bailii ISA1307]